MSVVLLYNNIVLFYNNIVLFYNSIVLCYSSVVLLYNSIALSQDYLRVQYVIGVWYALCAVLFMTSAVCYFYSEVSIIVST